MVLLIRQLVQAIEHMHLCRVVHRDLNPRNVFLELQGEEVSFETKVKIIDFNVSRILGPSNCNLDPTDFDMSGDTSDLVFAHKSTKVGTPIYRAPELCSMKGKFYT